MKFLGFTFFEKKVAIRLPYRTPEELKLRMARTGARRTLFETPPEAQPDFGEFTPLAPRPEP